jgi:hypothetical protein
MIIEAKIGSCHYKPRSVDSYQKLGKIRNNFSPRISHGSMSLLTLDFGAVVLLIQMSGLHNKRDYIPVVSSHQICGSLLQQP